MVKAFRFNQLFKRMDRLMKRMEAKFDSMDAQFDSMDALFDKFPGFSNWTITEHFAPAEPVQGESRDSVEYKTFRLDPAAGLGCRGKDDSVYVQQRQLEESLNLLGMDGWDLVAIHGNCAIFSRGKEAAVAGSEDNGDHR